MFPHNLSFYKIIWEILVQRGRPHGNTIWRAYSYFTRRITNATDTHPQYVKILLFHGNNGYLNSKLYVYSCITCLVFLCGLQQPNSGLRFLYDTQFDSHNRQHSSHQVISLSQRSLSTQQTQKTNIHALSRFRSCVLRHQAYSDCMGFGVGLIVWRIP
jgi:hypothetical protein